MQNDEEVKKLIALNVRKIMVLQDCSQTHLATVLNLQQGTISQKLNCKIKFFTDELEKLATFFNVDVAVFTSEELDENQVKAVAHKATVKADDLPAPSLDAIEFGTVRKDIPIPVDEEEENIVEALIQHIATSGEISEVGEMKLNIFRATLTGKIDDIYIFLVNVFLVMAIKSYQKKRRLRLPLRELTEEEERRFVAHYTQEFEHWKRGLWTSEDKEIRLMLINNKRSSVHNIVSASSKALPTKWINDLLNDCKEVDDVSRVDVSRLTNRIGQLIEELMHAKKPLDDYLYDQLNVSGS